MAASQYHIVWRHVTVERAGQSRASRHRMHKHQRGHLSAAGRPSCRLWTTGTAGRLGCVSTRSCQRSTSWHRRRPAALCAECHPCLKSSLPGHANDRQRFCGSLLAQRDTICKRLCNRSSNTFAAQCNDARRRPAGPESRCVSSAKPEYLSRTTSLHTFATLNGPFWASLPSSWPTKAPAPRFVSNAAPGSRTMMCRENLAGVDESSSRTHSGGRLMSKCRASAPATSASSESTSASPSALALTSGQNSRSARTQITDYFTTLNFRVQQVLHASMIAAEASGRVLEWRSGPPNTSGLPTGVWQNMGSATRVLTVQLAGGRDTAPKYRLQGRSSRMIS